jgi:hypothetical protein
LYLPLVVAAPGAANEQTPQISEALETGKPASPESAAIQGSSANLLDPYHFRASEDFVLAGRRDILVSMPVTGTVRLTGPLNKLGPTTDDITVLVYHADITGMRTLVFSQGLAWDQSGIISPTVRER